MAAAVQRLEVLLRDPGAVRVRDAQTDVDQLRAVEDPAPGVDADDQPVGASGAAAADEQPRSRPRRHVWTSKAEAGPSAPPRRPIALAPPILRPAAAGALNAKRRPPGALLAPLLTRIAGSKEGSVYPALAESAGAIRAVLAFSTAIAAAALAWPLSVVAALDIALPQASSELLAAVALITLAVFILAGLLDLARRRILARIGAEFEMRLGPALYEAAVRGGAAASTHAADAFDGWRRFAFGPAPAAALDVLATPLAIAATALIDWRLGAATACAAALLAGISLQSARSGGLLLQEATSADRRAARRSPDGAADRGSAAAMGFVGVARDAWLDARAEALSWRLLAADKSSGAIAASTATRWIAQASILGYAAWLALAADISLGGALGAALLSGAALGPILRLIAAFDDYVAARASFTQIAELLDRRRITQSRKLRTRIAGAIEAKSLRIAGPDGRDVLLSGITFKVERGQTLLIDGPSGAGKSLLAKTIVGLCAPLSGELLFDGAALDKVRSDATARQFGYLPQAFSLRDGTIAEAIGRARDGAAMRDVLAAANAAYAHHAIQSLPRGYETDLAGFGDGAPAGLMQRIALARALFGGPAIVVLDEPSNNLDDAGADALLAALNDMKARGQTVIVITRDAAVANSAHATLKLELGRQRSFTLRDAAATPAQPAAADPEADLQSRAARR